MAWVPEPKSRDGNTRFFPLPNGVRLPESVREGVVFAGRRRLLEEWIPPLRSE